MRLVGSGAAAPARVKAAAFGCFAVAAAAGLALVVLTQLWWLLRYDTVVAVTTAPTKPKKKERRAR